MKIRALLQLNQSDNRNNPTGMFYFAPGDLFPDFLFRNR